MVYSFPPPKAATTKKVMMVIWVAVATLGVGFGFSVIGMLQSNTLPATGYSCRQILMRWIGSMFRLPYMRFLGDFNFGYESMIAGTNARLHKYDSSVKSNLPLCLTAAETCDHVLKYEQEDRVRCFSFSSLTIICKHGCNQLVRTPLALGDRKYQAFCVVSRNSQRFGQCVEDITILVCSSSVAG